MAAGADPRQPPCPAHLPCPSFAPPCPAPLPDPASPANTLISGPLPCSKQVPEGPRTEATLRNNIAVCIRYMAAWIGGTGCVPLYNLMEDAATAEISRAQVPGPAVPDADLLSPACCGQRASRPAGKKSLAKLSPRAMLSNAAGPAAAADARRCGSGCATALRLTAARCAPQVSAAAAAAAAPPPSRYLCVRICASPPSPSILTRPFVRPYLALGCRPGAAGD